MFFSTTYGDITTGINPDTGDYTAGWGGTYQISWSMQNMDHDNENLQGLELRKNGESIPEVYFDTHWDDNSITYSGETRPLSTQLLMMAGTHVCLYFQLTSTR